MADDNTKPIPGWAATLFVVICVGLVSIFSMASEPLREVGSGRYLCPVYDEDGGVLPAAVGPASYSSIDCYNKSSTVVYVGSVTSAVSGTGYEVCNGTSCVTPTFGMDTHKGQLYCSTASATADGGTPLICAYGW